MIETLEDIIEDVANQIGVYGSHEEQDDCECRSCFMAKLRGRIEEAVRVEGTLDLERRVANLERRILPFGTREAGL